MTKEQIIDKMIKAFGFEHIYTITIASLAERGDVSEKTLAETAEGLIQMGCQCTLMLVGPRAPVSVRRGPKVPLYQADRDLSSENLKKNTQNFYPKIVHFDENASKVKNCVFSK